jgi:hypothetical protein
VFQRRAGGGSLVFEDRHVGQAIVLAQGKESLPVNVDNSEKLVARKFRHRAEMIRTLNEDFVLACSQCRLENDFVRVVLHRSCHCLAANAG